MTDLSNVPPISEQDLAFLKSVDSPTIANAIEPFKVRDRTEGFIGGEVRSLFPEMPPMVGGGADSDDDEHARRRSRGRENWLAHVRGAVADAGALGAGGAGHQRRAVAVRVGRRGDGHDGQAARRGRHGDRRWPARRARGAPARIRLLRPLRRRLPWQLRHRRHRQADHPRRSGDQDRRHPARRRQRRRHRAAAVLGGCRRRWRRSARGSGRRWTSSTARNTRWPRRDSWRGTDSGATILPL